MKIDLLHGNTAIELDQIIEGAKESYSKYSQLKTRTLNEDGSYSIPMIKMPYATFCGYLEEIIKIGEELKKRL